MEVAGIKDRLRAMDNYDFEHFVADLWERQGWNCEVSQASVDAGIDVTATRNTPYNQKVLIQVKRYGENTTVGGPEIQQYASLKHQQRDADSVIVVTSNRFTTAAHERAQELNVKLVDGDQLEQLINNLNAHNLIKKYGAIENADNQKIDNSNNYIHHGYNSSAETGQIHTGASRRSGSFWSNNIYLHNKYIRSVSWQRVNLASILIGLLLLSYFISYAASVEPGSTAPIPNSVALAMVAFCAIGLTVPVTLYLDILHVRAETDWDPDVAFYVYLGMPMPYLTYPKYYLKRLEKLGI
jgi:hypothetical protein